MNSKIRLVDGDEVTLFDSEDELKEYLVKFLSPVYSITTHGHNERVIGVMKDGKEHYFGVMIQDLSEGECDFAGLKITRVSI